MKSLTQSLSEIIRIESIKSSDTAPGAPFGREIRRALDYALELAEQMGFVTRQFDGYVGEVEFGSGETVLGVLGHLDVVPIGGGWTKEQGAVEDGVIYGRGAVDNKGPVLASLYAMKELKDEGFCPNKTVRLIMGCDEESGFGCMEHYAAIGRMPDEGFSPDADFPLVICEKTIFQLKLDIDSSWLKDAGVVELSGGHRTNMVADHASVSINEGGKVTKFEFLGRSAHGSTPQEGDNAIWKLFGFLGGRYPDNAQLKALNRYLMCKEALVNSGLYVRDEKSGDQTLNVGKVSYDPVTAIMSLLLDCRCPISQDTARLKSVIEELCGGVSTVTHGMPYLYADPDSHLVKSLLAAYREVTGDNSPGKIIGGGTYARALKKGVAFGPSFPGQTTRVHDADEYTTIDNLLKAKEIYKLAIRKLCE